MDKALKLKICGMRDPANIREVAALKPDYMGFIFYPASPRYCPDITAEITSSLPPSVTPVAVSVDMPLEEIASLASDLSIPVLQLHGDESPAYCRRLGSMGFKVWKAISLKDLSDLDKLEDYLCAVDAFLFDTPSSAKGGSGRKFNWEILKKYSLPVPFMLSGGIGPEDKKAVNEFSHPMLMGLDLNSRFEISPAIKDVTLISHFIKSIH